MVHSFKILNFFAHKQFQIQYKGKNITAVMFFEFMHKKDKGSAGIWIFDLT